MNKFTIKTIAVFLLISGLLISSAPTSGYEITDSYTNLEHEAVSFSTFEGEYLFVDGMATDCGHCQVQHGVLEDLYESHGHLMHMLSLAIWARQSVEEMQEFVDDYPTPWEAGYDPDQSFASKYNIEGTPTMILFSEDGSFITSWVGETPLSKLQDDINYIMDNEIQNSDEELPTSIGSGAPSEPSLIEKIFSNPIFQGTTLTVLVLAIYFKSSSSNPTESKKKEKKMSAAEKRVLEAQKYKGDI